MMREHELVRDVLALVKEFAENPPPKWRDHPALVDGNLLVTPQEYDAIKKAADERYWERQEYLRPPVQPIGEITVVVIYPNREPVRFGDRYAINHDGKIYLFHKDIGELPAGRRKGWPW